MSKLGRLDAIRFSNLLKKFRKSPKAVRTYYPLHLLSCTYYIPKVDLQKLQFGTSINFPLFLFRAQYYRNSEKITSFRRTPSLFPHIDKQCQLLHSRAATYFPAKYCTYIYICFVYSIQAVAGPTRIKEC